MDMSYRFTGRLAIASGIIGLMAFGFLVWALVPQWHLGPGDEVLRWKAHDAGVIIQFLLMIPVVFKLNELFRKPPQEKSQSIFILGIGALLITVLLLLMMFFKIKIIAEVLYMVPQGVFGVWLMIVNKRTAGIFSKGLRRLGIVAGFGLLIVGAFPILFAVLVDMIILQGVAPKGYIAPATTANFVIHLMLIFGTLMGVTTYPIWTLLVGRQFLHEGAISQKQA